MLFYPALTFRLQNSWWMLQCVYINHRYTVLIHSTFLILEYFVNIETCPLTKWIIYSAYEILKSDKYLEVLYDSDLLCFIRIVNKTIELRFHRGVYFLFNVFITAMLPGTYFFLYNYIYIYIVRIVTFPIRALQEYRRHLNVLTIYSTKQFK